MDTLETLFSRKSVRSYTGEQVTEAELATILQAANASPVARGVYEAVHLTVIQNPEILEQIDRNAAAFFGDPTRKPLYNAPTLLLISGKKPITGRENVVYSNCAIVAHNVCLAAAELGLGQCCIWGAIRALAENPELLEKLALPEGFEPCCSVTLGKTAENYTLRQIPQNRIGCNFVK